MREFLELIGLCTALAIGIGILIITLSGAIKIAEIINPTFIENN